MASRLSYAAPPTVQAAVAILGRGVRRGQSPGRGNDLLVQLRSGHSRPDLIVDIKRIPGLIGIREADGCFVIGAATPCAVIGEHRALREAWPGVVRPRV